MTAKQKKMTAVALGFSAFELVLIILMCLWLGLLPGLLVGLGWPTLVAANRALQRNINVRIVSNDRHR